MSDASGPSGGRVAGPRLIALVGPFQSGKTTLFESLLARAGAVARAQLRSGTLLSRPRHVGSSEPQGSTR